MALTVALTDPGKEPYSNYKDHYRKPIDPLSPKLEGAGLQHQGTTKRRSAQHFRLRGLRTQGCRVRGHRGFRFKKWLSALFKSKRYNLKHNMGSIRADFGHATFPS